MSSDEAADRRSDRDPGLPGPAPGERQRPSGRRNKQGIRVDPDVEAEPSTRRTVISVLVDHEPGVLSEVSGLFSRRQFNIESLTVGPTADEEYARITLVVEESDPGIDQVEKQLQKLLPVISVRELAPDAMRRELALVKVDATHPDRVSAVADMYDAKATDAGPETATFEVTGSRQKVEAAIETFERFGIRELVRTGTAALARGPERTADYPADHAAAGGAADRGATDDADRPTDGADLPTDDADEHTEDYQ